MTAAPRESTPAMAGASPIGLRRSSHDAVVVAGTFREFMASFPTGVSIVGAIDDAGQPCGMTCSSLTSVCLEPPTLLVCLTSRSTTLAAMLARGRFSVNLLARDTAALARQFASRLPDRYAGVAWSASPTGMPWLDDHIVGAADCRVSDCSHVGDHDVVVGVVEHVTLWPRAPLLYGRRQFANWSGAVTQGQPREVTHQGSGGSARDHGGGEPAGRWSAHVRAAIASVWHT